VEIRIHKIYAVKKFNDKAVGSQDVHPGKNPDKEIGPEGDDDKEQEKRLMFAPGHIITAGKGDEYGYHGGNNRNKNCSERYDQIVGIPETPVGFQREDRIDTSVQSLLEKAVNNNDHDGNKEEGREPDRHGR
jgi:hypothetical protein